MGWKNKTKGFVLNEAQTRLSVLITNLLLWKIDQVLQKCSAGDGVLLNQHAMKWLDKNIKMMPKKIIKTKSEINEKNRWWLIN